MPQTKAKTTPKATNGAHEPTAKIVVNWNDMTANPFTGREIRDFERAQPMTFMALEAVTRNDGAAIGMPWDTLLALVWILHRRTDPAFTFDNMLDLRADEWDVEGIAVSDDPTAESAGDATPTGS